MPQRKQWVVGFLFRNKSEVALISKTHPAWQAGKLNGVGGKIVEGESPLEAMTREFREEAGVEIPDWRAFALLHIQDGDLYCFTAEGDYPLKALTEEKVDWYPIASLTKLKVIANVHWLIPLALDGGNKHASIDYYQAASE